METQNDETNSKDSVTRSQTEKQETHLEEETSTESSPLETSISKTPETDDESRLKVSRCFI